jgi:outer membrane protein assembly factor BamA
VPFERPTITLGYTFPWCHDGFLNVATSGGLRIQQGTTIDNTASWSVRLATPTYFQLGRIIAQSEVDTRWNDSQNAFFTIGGDPALRGFALNQFHGERRFTAQLEVRTLPVSVWVLRAGGVLFWDSGGAANSLTEMQIHNDVGVGVRGLVPQLSRFVYRFDLAFPLDGIGAGSPRFIAAFDSAF